MSAKLFAEEYFHLPLVIMLEYFVYSQ